MILVSGRNDAMNGRNKYLCRSETIGHMNKLITEGIGTFFLMLAILLSTGPWAALAIGLMLMALMYSGMRLSGSQYNPAVSLALLLQGRLHRDEFPGYIFAQLCGATLAAIMGGFLLTFHTNAEVVVRTNHTLGVLTGEFLGTFMLIYVYLHVILPEKTRGNQYYGLVIGLTLTALMSMFTEVSGAIFNPAVAVGLSISGKLAWSDLWMYFITNLLGAAVAGTVFTLVKSEE
jgi:aquaporin Z